MFFVDREDREVIRKELSRLISQAEETRKLLEGYRLEGSRAKAKQDADKFLDRILKDDIHRATDDQLLNNLHRAMTVFKYYAEVATGIADRLQKGAAQINESLATWQTSETRLTLIVPIGARF